MTRLKYLKNNHFQVAKALRDAAAVVERRWTQGAAARDSAGNAVDCNAPNATCWCAVGAIVRFAGGVGNSLDAVAALSGHIFSEGDLGAVSVWNDSPGRTAEDVASTLRICADRVERGEL